jgi:hypothetical protein
MNESVKIGNIEFTPHFLLFLREASYFLIYDNAHAYLTLLARNTGPNNRLLAVENCDVKTAERLATLLGLPQSKHDHELRIWGKRNLYFRLHYDDSPLSQTLYNMLTDLKLPHDVRYGSTEVALERDGIKYREHKIGERGLKEIIVKAAQEKS